MRRALPLLLALLVGIAAGRWLLGPTPPGVGESAPEAPGDEEVRGAQAPAARTALARDSGGSGPRASDAPPPAATLQGVHEGADDVRRRVAAEYWAVAHEPMPEDFLEAAVKNLRSHFEAAPAWQAKAFAERQALRKAFGEFTDVVDFELQVRGEGRVALLPESGRGDRGVVVSEIELDVSKPQAPGEPSSIFRRGAAIVPLGRRVVIERIDVEARFWDAKNGGEVSVNGVFQSFNSRRPIRISLVGAGVPWGDGSEGSQVIAVRGGAAKVRYRGRLIDPAKERPTPLPFAWDGGSQEGFFAGDRVVLQAVHHAGVSFLGADDPSSRDLSDRDLWDPGVDLSSLRRGAAHVEGGGRIPPGKAFEVDRIEYRARLDARKGRGSHLRIKVGGRLALMLDAAKDSDPAGTWKAPEDSWVLPGAERSVELEVGQNAIGEATIFGALVDHPTR